MGIETSGEPSRATTWVSYGLETLVDKHRWMGDPKLLKPDKYDFDVVVVGSGYGGAVAAAELSACKKADGKPLDICVLERGKEYLAGMFPSRLADLGGHVRFTTPNAERQRGVYDGLYDIRWSEDVVALVASGVGGGSLINAGVMEMPIDKVFEEVRWPRAIRDDRASLDKLAKGLRPWLGASQLAVSGKDLRRSALERLSGTYGVDPVHVSVAPPCCEDAKEVAPRDENAKNAAGVPMTPCNLCGDCATGCNYNAKESLDRNLLRLAQQTGAQIVTGATVLRLAPADTSKGWLLEVNHTDAHLRDRQRKPFVVRARRVILAAGTFGSTEILMRSKKLRLSAQLGRKFSANGDMIAAALELNDTIRSVADENEDPIGGGRGIGPTITGMIDLRTGDPETDVVIQDLAVPGPLRRLFEESFTTTDVLNRLIEVDPATAGSFAAHVDDAAVDPGAFQRSLVVAMIGRDGAEGELRAAQRRIPLCADGMLTVRWPTLRRDTRFAKHHERLGKLLEKAGRGGRVLNNPLWSPLSAPIQGVFGTQHGPLVTVHPLGGCTMAEDIRKGVTDHLGRVFDGGKSSPTSTYDGLVVLDGSIVPTSLGINPALTIAVLALRAVVGLKEKWELRGGRLSKRPADRPADARPQFSIPFTRTDPRPTRIELTEQMRGVVNLRERDGTIAPRVVELTLTTEPAELASLIGRDASAGHILKVARAASGHALPGRLRILHAGKDVDPLSHEAKADDVAVIAEVSGEIRLFRVLRPRFRVVRASWAWLRNRALRDFTQSQIERFRRWLRLVPPSATPSRPPRHQLCNTWRLLSRAGSVRLIEYDLRIDSIVKPDSTGALDGSKFDQQPIRGVKRLTYARFGSPWAQLMEMTLEKFPQMARNTFVSLHKPSKLEVANPPILKFNPRYVAQKGVPLFRVVGQQDRVAALIDLLSFGLYVLRILLQVHALSFRRPDAPADRVPQRLPSALPAIPMSFGLHMRRIGLWVRDLAFGKPDAPADRAPRRLPGALPAIPAPEIDWLIVDRKRNVFVRLARYDGRPRLQRSDTLRRPVLLIHGYSASGTTFAHHAVKGNLVRKLYEDGRDVWVLDMRSSAGLATAIGDWPFEDMGMHDIPIAIRHIRAATEARRVDIVAHCMGGAMFSMAVLSDRDRNGEPNHLHEKIGRVVFSQVGPVMMLSPANVLAAYVMRYVRHFLALEKYEFSPRTDPHGEVSLAGQALDRALAAIPTPTKEYRLENPLWPPGKATPWVGTRHRMDALYSRTFSLANMPRKVLDYIDDFFGPLSVSTVSQVIHFAGFNTVTDRHGVNKYVTPDRVRDRLKFPIMSIHGEENGLIDVATLELMRNILVIRENSSEVPYLNRSWDAVARHQDAVEIEEDIDNARLVVGKPSLLTWRIRGHGHQDCLIGKRAGNICGVITTYLGKPDAPAETESNAPLAEPAKAGGVHGAASV